MRQRESSTRSVPVRRQGAAVPWAEARIIAGTAVQPLPATEVTVGQALGSTLAEPLHARAALPVQDVSAMDGYAVSGPGPWTLHGRILAGDRRSYPPVLPGTAVEVATGAALPPGVTAVLPYEAAHRRDGLLRGPAVPGRHVRRRGEDCRPGQLLLPAGTPVTPAVLGIAAATGHDALPVRLPPSVAAAVTGSELSTAGLPGPGRVRDAVGPMLPGLVDALGGTLVRRDLLPDGAEVLREWLGGATADVLLLSGATSRGAADHARPVLAALGARILVPGVRCRPGHPQFLALLPDGRCAVGLPGNPFAAMAALLTLLGPLLQALAAGRPRPVRYARLAVAVPAHPVDTRLVPVRLAHGRAAPVGHDAPSLLLGAALADALAVVPPGGGAPVGEVELLPLPG
ncbi:molybdopterin molybdotransferase MoeA [Streptacidiphilus sp. N1-12]|uniref:Molybdopterin molybdenumtransferase n=2 Tax=Streptacidiphilus alkalitolerans TaxID=3342712 RepID=A0ABV6WAG3_9ACTN